MRTILAAFLAGTFCALPHIGNAQNASSAPSLPKYQVIDATKNPNLLRQKALKDRAQQLVEQEQERRRRIEASFTPEELACRRYQSAHEVESDMTFDATWYSYELRGNVYDVRIDLTCMGKRVDEGGVLVRYALINDAGENGQVQVLGLDQENLRIRCRRDGFQTQHNLILAPDLGDGWRLLIDFNRQCETPGMMIPESNLSNNRVELPVEPRSDLDVDDDRYPFEMKYGGGHPNRVFKPTVVNRGNLASADDVPVRVELKFTSNRTRVIEVPLRALAPGEEYPDEEERNPFQVEYDTREMRCTDEELEDNSNCRPVNTVSVYIDPENRSRDVNTINNHRTIKLKH